MQVRVYNLGSVARTLKYLDDSGEEKSVSIAPSKFVVMEQESILYTEKQLAELGMKMDKLPSSFPPPRQPVPAAPSQKEAAAKAPSKPVHPDVQLDEKA